MVNSMYGLVNKAIKDFICTNYGETYWQAIRHEAGITIDEFVRMNSYPDEMSYRLVAAASLRLNLQADQFLEAIGAYWTKYTAQEGYGEMLKATGHSLFECLQNLDNLHTRVRLFYPDLKPPHFECSEISEHALFLHYYSERIGLAPMVCGLVVGLGEVFNTPVTVQQVMSKNAGGDHDTFLVLLTLE